MYNEKVVYFDECDKTSKTGYVKGHDLYLDEACTSPAPSYCLYHTPRTGQMMTTPYGVVRNAQYELMRERMRALGDYGCAVTEAVFNAVLATEEGKNAGNPATDATTGEKTPVE